MREILKCLDRGNEICAAVVKREFIDPFGHTGMIRYKSYQDGPVFCSCDSCVFSTAGKL